MSNAGVYSRNKAKNALKTARTSLYILLLTAYMINTHENHSYRCIVSFAALLYLAWQRGECFIACRIASWILAIIVGVLFAPAICFSVALCCTAHIAVFVSGIVFNISSYWPNGKTLRFSKISFKDYMNNNYDNYKHRNDISVNNQCECCMQYDCKQLQHTLSSSSKNSTTTTSSLMGSEHENGNVNRTYSHTTRNDVKANLDNSVRNQSKTNDDHRQSPVTLLPPIKTTSNAEEAHGTHQSDSELKKPYNKNECSPERELPKKEEICSSQQLPQRVWMQDVNQNTIHGERKLKMPSKPLRSRKAQTYARIKRHVLRKGEPEKLSTTGNGSESFINDTIYNKLSPRGDTVEKSASPVRNEETRNMPSDNDHRGQCIYSAQDNNKEEEEEETRQSQRTSFSSSDGSSSSSETSLISSRQSAKFQRSPSCEFARMWTRLCLHAFLVHLLLEASYCNVFNFVAILVTVYVSLRVYKCENEAFIEKHLMHHSVRQISAALVCKWLSPLTSINLIAKNAT